ncbi:MAG: hypothetical protein HC904_17145, partial [Blastochloris sp.]|nr:hypothetical protein [Blastochloris sp.]
QIHIDGKDMGLFRLFPNTEFEIEHPSDDSGCFTFYELGSSEGAAAGIKANDKLGVVEVTFYPEKQNPKSAHTPLPAAASNPAPSAAAIAAASKPVPSGASFSPEIRFSRSRRSHAGSGTLFMGGVGLGMGGAGFGDSAMNENSGTSDSGQGVLSSGVKARDTDFEPNTYDKLFEENADEEFFDPTGLRAGGTGLSGESKQTYSDVERIEYDLDAAVTISLRLAAVSLNSATPRPLKSNSNRVPPPLS